MMEKIASEFRFDSLVYPNNIKETVTCIRSDFSVNRHVLSKNTNFRYLNLYYNLIINYYLNLNKMLFHIS